MRHLLTVSILVVLVEVSLWAQSPNPSSKTVSTPNQSPGSPVLPTVASSTPVGSALTTIFSPSRAPKRKTMGLLQRSFLDLADQGDQELEVALVVDGTDSMATELSGVRQSIHQMLNDLRQYRNSEVRAAIVVYRDAGSPSGEVLIPQKEFTADRELINKAVEALQPESGAPFFHELPDLGLHTAIEDLPWSNDDQVTKWILMFGDAPPYSESFADAATPQAKRRFATSLLVNRARLKNIRINCVLCTSSDNASGSYDKAIDETRGFMNSLCAGTDGLMLDLSYPQIRTALIEAGSQPTVALQKIEPIEAIDLAAVRRENQKHSQQVKQVNLAVIPHMSLAKISFDPSHPAVQVSTALRTRLSRVPGVRVASPQDIKKQLRRLRAEGLAGDQAIRGLAARLGVDYVVWGTIAKDNATVQTAAYRRDNGKSIVPIKLAKYSDDIAYVLIQASARGAPQDQALAQLIGRMETMKESVTAPMAENVATNADLLAAIEFLDQALAFELGSEQGADLLASADRASKNAITAEPRNPLAHWLQSNVAYNQAMRSFRQGNVAEAEARMREMKSALTRAAKDRGKARIPSLETEIFADFQLLVNRNPAKAINSYTQMTEPSQPLATQLRGHWMLAGIYAGDWGNVEKDVVDPEKARQHITEVMANWPHSPEASLLKQWLRWDETKQQTDFNFLPKLNMQLSDA